MYPLLILALLGPGSLTETFQPTPAWLKVEPLIFEVAKAGQANPGEVKLLLGITWNESRGRPGVTGDAGCAVGLTQLHLGGFSDDHHRCYDIRGVLPPELRLPRQAYWEPRTALEATLALLRHLGSQNDPEGALERYAGCRPATRCARNLHWLHRHWWATGLEKRLLNQPSVK